GNQLEALTLDCSSLKMLKELSLADNKISCISESIGELQALESFWLYGNMLSKVPSNLANMKALSNLWLEGNMLEPEQLEKLLPKFSHLRALGIDNLVKLPTNLPRIMEKVLRVSELLGTGAAPQCGGYFKLEHSTGIDQVQIDTNVVVVAFGSAPGVPNWGGLLRRVKAEMNASNIRPAFDILYVVDSRRSWYTEHQSMITTPSKRNLKPLHQEKIPRICQYFYNELEEALKNYKAIVMLGDSMGASAALTFSSLATSVIAFCPQVMIRSEKLRDEEDVAAYLLWVDEVVNAIRGLGEKIEEPVIVQKVLRSLPLRFDAKVSVIEEMKDLDKLSMDELHGILTAYEMRTESNKPAKKEAAFKVSKKKAIKESEANGESNSEENENEALFIRKLKKGSGRYKGKLPFKCFNCGKIGHFAAKCPEKEDSEDEESKPKFKREFKQSRGKKRFEKQKKSLYSKRGSSSSEESGISDSDSDEEETLFMAIEEGSSTSKVDLEGINDIEEEEELICALGEIKALKKRNQKQRLRHQKYEEQNQSFEAKLAQSLEESKNLIIDLKTQIEEAKRIEEGLRSQLKVK
ncbi:hypothetical protein KI387_014222, partial [Taxus chinensis]